MTLDLEPSGSGTVGQLKVGTNDNGGGGGVDGCECCHGSGVSDVSNSGAGGPESVLFDAAFFGSTHLQSSTGSVSVQTLFTQSSISGDVPKRNPDTDLSPRFRFRTRV